MSEQDPFAPVEQTETDAKALAEQVRKLQTHQFYEDLAAVLSTEQGKRVFEHYFSLGKMLDASFIQNSGTFYRGGQQSIINGIFSDISVAAPAVAAEMMLTAAQRLSVQKREDLRK